MDDNKEVEALREFIENGLEQKYGELITTLGGNLHDWRNVSGVAKTIDQWIALVDADFDGFRDNWLRGEDAKWYSFSGSKKAITLLRQYVWAQHRLNRLRNWEKDTTIGALKHLLVEVKNLQKMDVYNIMRAFFEFRRNYKEKNDSRSHRAAILAVGASPHYHKHRFELIRGDPFCKTLVRTVEGALAAAGKKDINAVNQTLGELFILFAKQTFESSQNGLGLIHEAISEAFAEYGFIVKISDDGRGISVSVTDQGAHYLSTLYAEEPKRTTKKFIEWGMYVYEWWYFSKEQYEIIKHEQTHPRVRGATRAEVRETTRKPGDPGDDTFSAKHTADQEPSRTGGYVLGKYSGKRGVCDRATKWEDVIKDAFKGGPPFDPQNGVVALGVARVPLGRFFRKTNFFKHFHRLSPDKQKGIVSRWIDEGKLEIDKQNFGPWHWTAWDKQIEGTDSDPGAEILGRVVVWNDDGLGAEQILKNHYPDITYEALIEGDVKVKEEHLLKVWEEEGIGLEGIPTALVRGGNTAPGPKTGDEGVFTMRVKAALSGFEVLAGSDSYKGLPGLLGPHVYEIDSYNSSELNPGTGCKRRYLPLSESKRSARALIILQKTGRTRQEAQEEEEEEKVETDEMKELQKILEWVNKKLKEDNDDDKPSLERFPWHTEAEKKELEEYEEEVREIQKGIEHLKKYIDLGAMENSRSRNMKNLAKLWEDILAFVTSALAIYSTDDEGERNEISSKMEERFGKRLLYKAEFYSSLRSIVKHAIDELEKKEA